MKRYILLLLTLVFVSSAFGQDPITGFPPYGSFNVDTFDAINRQNLNINFSIPIVQTRGRGQDFNFSIVYDSWMWTRSGGAWASITDSDGRPTWGWKVTAGVTGQLITKYGTVSCVWFDP